MRLRSQTVSIIALIQLLLIILFNINRLFVYREVVTSIAI